MRNNKEKDSYFLVTTALKETWNEKVKTIFLGDWCLIFNKFDKDKYPNHIVNYYHWDDKEKFVRDIGYLDNLYETKLEEMSNVMNKIHNEIHDKSYWRIVIGPWLKSFIDVIFDRYESIHLINSEFKIDNTYCFKATYLEWIPKDFNEYWNLIKFDEWNHLIYSEIIKYLGIPFNEIDMPLPRKLVSKRKNILKKIFNYINNYYNKILPNKFNNNFIVSGYFKPLQLIKFHLFLKQIPQFLNYELEIKRTKTFEKDVRSKIILNNNNKFEVLLNDLIRKQIPTSYVENYKLIKKKADRFFPKYPKVILTSNAYDSNEAFKFWVASKKESLNTKYIINQHGGNFGICYYSQTERHQIVTSDLFTTWGWMSSTNEKIKPMPSYKLKQFKYKKTNKSSSIQLLIASYPKHFYTLIDQPNASQNIEYFKGIESLLNNLENNVRGKIKIRIHQDVYGWKIKERFHKLGFKDKLEDSSLISFKKSTNNSSISICTFNSTTFLETLSANVPTLIFFSSDRYLLRDDAKPLFEKLKDVKIFFETPEELAEHLNNIHLDIDKWWGKPKVQKVKNEFCYHFARTSNEWTKVWVNLFKKSW
jgi:putative transferase (TIGR04331 family)